jgi:hypothetical protein
VLLRNFAEKLLNPTAISDGFVNFENQLRCVAQPNSFADFRTQEAGRFIQPF